MRRRVSIVSPKCRKRRRYRSSRLFRRISVHPWWQSRAKCPFQSGWYWPGVPCNIDPGCTPVLDFESRRISDLRISWAASVPHASCCP